MTDRPIRRTILAALVYAAVAMLVLPATDGFRRLLALPQMFGQAVRIMIWVGLPITLLLAWKYPSLGHGGEVPTDDIPPEE